MSRAGVHAVVGKQGPTLALMSSTMRACAEVEGLSAPSMSVWASSSMYACVGAQIGQKVGCLGSSKGGYMSRTKGMAGEG